MKVFCVSGVGTGIGKTFVAQKLTEHFQDLGYRCLSLKPIETGVEGQPEDSLIHLTQARKIFPSLRLKDINLYSFPLPSAPCVADEKKIIDLEHIYRHLESFEDRVDILLIEGAGGLFVPIKKDFFVLSLALELQKRFCSKTLVVCDAELGMIHRFLSAKFVTDSLKLKSLFFLNIRDQQAFEKISLPFMQDYAFQTCIPSLAKIMLDKE